VSKYYFRPALQVSVRYRTYIKINHTAARKRQREYKKARLDNADDAMFHGFAGAPQIQILSSANQRAKCEVSCIENMQLLR